MDSSMYIPDLCGTDSEQPAYLQLFLGCVMSQWSKHKDEMAVQSVLRAILFKEDISEAFGYSLASVSEICPLAATLYREDKDQGLCTEVSFNVGRFEVLIQEGYWRVFSEGEELADGNQNSMLDCKIQALAWISENG